MCFLSLNALVGEIGANSIKMKVRISSIEIFLKIHNIFFLNYSGERYEP